MANRRFLKAASYLILEKDGKILFMRRFQTGYMDGAYGLPSGHLEDNENPEQCVIREVKEEIDIEIKNPQFVCVTYTKENYLDLFFTVDDWTGEPRICEPSKCDDMQWFDKNHLPELMPPEVESAIQNYKEGNYYSNV